MTYENCTLVALKLSAWTASKHDKAASANVEHENNAQCGAARVYKTLVSKDWLDPIRKIDNRIRSEFYRLTLAYPITSVGLLPNDARERFNDRMAALFSERQDRVEAALSAYDAELERARLGDLFNESDYPSVAEVRAKYGHRIVTLPMPNAQRSGIENAEVRAEIDETRREGLSEAYRDAWDRIAEIARETARKLKAYKPAQGNDKAQNVFRDSLVENARELVETLESMVAIFEDASLTAALATLKQDLARHSPETLRSDERIRAEVTNTALDLLDTALGRIDAGYNEPKRHETPQPTETIPAPVPFTPTAVPAIASDLDVDALLD